MLKKILSLIIALTIPCLSMSNIVLASSNTQIETSFDFDAYDFTDPSLMDKSELAPDADDIRNHYPTDEEFFGKWDADAQIWTQEPKLDYTHVSQYGGYNLEETLDCVKADDYEGAKAALLEYYRNVNKKRGVKALNSSTQTQWQAKLLMNNIHYYAGSSIRVADIVNVKKEWTQISADVLEEVQYFLTRDGGTSMSILLMALNKDGYEAQFASKENPLGKPYIELVVNGMTERIYPYEDVYVAAGENADKNYAYEDILRVEETEGDWKNAKLQDPVSSDTKRGYLLFSLARFGAGDVITSAQLKIQSRWVDNNYPQIEDDDYQKKVIVFSNTLTAWTETERTYNSFANVVFSYGERNDMPWIQPSGDAKPEQAWEEVLYRLNPWLPNMAAEYYASGNEEYARTVFLLLHNFILNTYCAYRGKEEGWEYPSGEEYSYLLEHGGYSSSLDLSVRGTSISQNLIYFYDSEYMTPELFTVFLKYIWSMGDLMSRFWGPNEIGGNWGAFGLNGFFCIMSYYPEFAGAKDEWRNILEDRLNSYSQSVHLTGGSSPEGSLSYAKGIYNNIYTIAQDAESLNVEFPMNDSIRKRLSTLLRFVVYMSNPWGGDPQYGDGSHYSIRSKPSILSVANWLDDDQVRWWATNGKQGTPMEHTSVLYPDSRRIAFRSSWDEEAIWLNGTVDGGYAQRWHSHWHDGAITLAAYGSYLLVDPLYNNYTATDLNTRWLASSRGHNSVEVNGYNNKAGISNLATAGLPRNGKPGSFTYTEMNDSYDFTRMWTPNAKDISYPDDYPFGDPPPTEPGADWYRNILMLKDKKFVIVSDHLEPADNTAENTYTQLWHTLPDSGLHIDGQYVLKDGETTGNISGEIDTQIENTHFVRGTGTGALKTSIRGETNIMIVPADISKVEPKLMRGLYSPGKDAFVDTEYGLFEQKAIGDVNFDTILFPVEEGKDFEIKSSPLQTELPQGKASAFTAGIKDVSGKTNEDYNVNYFLLHDTSLKEEQNFGDYSTDGVLAYYELNQNTSPRVAILKDGTSLKNKFRDYEIIYSQKDVIEDLSVTWRNSCIELDTTKEINLEDITIYAPQSLTSVTLNGETISFKQNKNYLYFGDEPILDGSAIPSIDNDTDSDNDSGNSGNSGNSGSSGSSGSSGIHGSKNPVNDNEEPIPPNPQIPQTQVSNVNKNYLNELENHWGKEEILPLIESGVIQGDGNSLKLKDAMTRAEFTSLIVRICKLDIVNYSGGFPDVDKNSWYGDAIQTAYDNGIIEGSNGAIQPDIPITREQATKILVKALELNKPIEQTESEEFKDSMLISSWAKGYVSKAVSIGLVKGDEQGNFNPTQNLLREQGMALIARLLKNI